MRKKLFISNTCMVLISLLMLLGISGIMVVIFKNEFLNWYGNISKLSDEHYQVYAEVPQLVQSGTDWETWADVLAAHNFRLLVMSEGETVYSNVKHNEWEGAESLFAIEKTQDVTTYFVEGVTIFTFTCEGYTLYLTGALSADSFLGMDKDSRI